MEDKLAYYDDNCECFFINTDIWLKEVLEEDKYINGLIEDLETEHNGWSGSIADTLCEYVFKNYEVKCSDNSYNHCSDLSDDINFTVIAPKDCDNWYYSEDTIVLLEKHLGGDPRGNYDVCKAYRLSGQCEAAFLDVYCGICLETLDGEYADIDNYQVGYTSEPQYHFNNDFTVLEVLDDKLLVERNEDKEKFYAYPDVRI